MDYWHHKSQNHDPLPMDFSRLPIGQMTPNLNRSQAIQGTKLRLCWIRCDRDCPEFDRLFWFDVKYPVTYIAKIILIKTELEFIWKLELMLIHIWRHHWWQDWRNYCCWRLILDDMIHDTMLVNISLSPKNVLLGHSRFSVGGLIAISSLREISLLHIIIILGCLMWRYCWYRCRVASIR